MTVPNAGTVTAARSSSISAISVSVSSSPVSPSPVFAETSTNSVFPPHATGVRPKLRHLRPDTVRLRTGFVDFADSHENGDAGAARALDRFTGLGPDTVVGGDDNNSDVGQGRPSGAHRR